MATSSESTATPQEINRLYWRSDLKIDEITEQLGIGRSTLYSSIRPAAAGASCPHCGERLVFANRTNRQANIATCTGCGREMDVARARATASSRAATKRQAADVDDDESFIAARWDRVAELAQDVDRERMVRLGSAAAVGLLIGAAIVYASRS